MGALLRRLDLRGTPLGALASRLPRPEAESGSAREELRAAVSGIIAEVRSRGDEALVDLGRRFDGVSPPSLRVPASEIAEALASIGGPLKDALGLAYERVMAYHAHRKPALGSAFSGGGVRVSELVIPVERAGLYAPGGRASYPSTVLMCAAPAQVAGVSELALCVPPGPDGRVAEVSLAAAAIAGIEEVYCTGGAQAVAAMAFGTETIRSVDVIVGPGNRYVAEAKSQVAGQVGVPSAYAGPSEVVVADESAEVSLAAVDVMVQAEHGPDGLAWLVTCSDAVADGVDAEMERLIGLSGRRAELEATLASGGYSVLVDDLEAAITVANLVAPEHLELMTEDPEALVPMVRNAGAVFLGSSTPATLGDYVAGPNHVLPTARTARFASALRVDDFCRHVHVVSSLPGEIGPLLDAVEEIALAEGLDMHGRSASMRRAGLP